LEKAPVIVIITILILELLISFLVLHTESPLRQEWLAGSRTNILYFFTALALSTLFSALLVYEREITYPVLEGIASIFTLIIGWYITPWFPSFSAFPIIPVIASFALIILALLSWLSIGKKISELETTVRGIKNSADRLSKNIKDDSSRTESIMQEVKSKMEEIRAFLEEAEDVKGEMYE